MATVSVVNVKVMYDKHDQIKVFSDDDDLTYLQLPRNKRLTQLELDHMTIHILHYLNKTLTTQDL
jgi:hypothetical protein